MANRLLKRSAVVYTPGTPAVQGRAGQYVSLEYAIYVGLVPPGTRLYGMPPVTVSGGWYNAQGYPTAAALLVMGIFGTGPVAGGPADKDGMWGTVPPAPQVWMPAVKARPAIPAKLSNSPQSGWNGGARSIRRMTGDGRVEFQLGPRNIGALVGLSGPQDSTNFGEATHAFYQTDGTLAIVERGVTVAAVAGVTLADRPVFSITRQRGVVTYAVQGFSYTSAQPSSGDVYLDALLYTADDYVDNPAVYNYQRASASGELSLNGFRDGRPRASGPLALDGVASLRQGGKVRGRAVGSVRLSGSSKGRTLNKAQASGTLILDGTAEPQVSRSTVRVPPHRVISSETTYARSTVRYAGLAMESSGGAPLLQTASSVVVHSPGVVESFGVTGGFGDSTARLRAGMYSADAALTPGPNDVWGRSRAVRTPPRMISVGARYSPLEFVLNEALVLLTGARVGSAINTGYDEWLRLSDEVEALVIEDAGYSELLLLSDNVNILYDIEVTLAESLRLTDRAGQAAGGLQVAVNAANGASGLYQGFDFLRLLSTPTGVLGVKADGVYRVTRRGGDDGTPVSAAVDFGGMTFAPGKSRLTNVFLACGTDGQLFVRVTADDGDERVYRVRQRGPIMRADTAQRIAGHTWRLRLELFEATDAKLSSVQLVAPDTGRRWTS